MPSRTAAKRLELARKGLNDESGVQISPSGDTSPFYAAAEVVGEYSI
jgi:hypothetical protein